MIQLIADGKEIELPSKGSKIKYTKQIADIFDIASIACSYTNSFDAPKTPNNTHAMEYLGIVGDGSTIPYRKIPARLNSHGFPVIPNGWLHIKETSDRYKLNIIDGMIDFFKAIDNKTMGSDLNLSQFSHTKDIESVVASFTNEYYKYLIADYNGKNEGVYEGLPGINIDYLVPGFNMRKLFDLVMLTFGYTFDPANLEAINDKYITYPKAPADNITDNLIATLNKGFYVRPKEYIGGGLYSVPSQYFWDSETIIEGTLLNNWRFVVPETTGYRLALRTEMYALYQQASGLSSGGYISSNQEYRPVTVQITKNSNTLTTIQTDPYSAVNIDYSEYFTQGDIIEVRFFVSDPFINGRYLTNFHHNSTELEIFKTNQGQVDLSEAFKDFQIKDFIKDVFWRTGVTPDIDTVNKHIKFVSLTERLDIANHIDWSKKYVKRFKETYINGGYAQKNIFRHKYNDEGASNYDGYLMVNNQNIEAEKTLVESKMFAPENVPHTFYSADQSHSIITKRFPIWERETKEDAGGLIEMSYKGLSNRFFVVALKQSPVDNWRFVSEQIAGTTTVTQFPYADTEGTTFDQIVPTVYAEYNYLLNGFKAHEIQLALGLEDYLSIDLTRPYYFEQEAGFYICNKVSFEDGFLASGEFVRINMRS